MDDMSFTLFYGVRRCDMHKEMSETEKQKKEEKKNTADQLKDDTALVVSQADGNRALITGKNDAKSEESLINMVNKPSKIVRIDDMVKKILEEVRSINPPLDDISRRNLQNTFEKFIQMIKTSVSQELAKEIDELVAPLSDAPSDIELRLAYTKLVGWLEGLFRGIQTILLTQQVMNQNAVGNLLAGRKKTEKEAQQKSDDSSGQYM